MNASLEECIHAALCIYLPSVSFPVAILLALFLRHRFRPLRPSYFHADRSRLIQFEEHMYFSLGDEDVSPRWNYAPHIRLVEDQQLAFFFYQCFSCLPSSRGKHIINVLLRRLMFCFLSSDPCLAPSPSTPCSAFLLTMAS